MSVCACMHLATMMDGGICIYACVYWDVIVDCIEIELVELQHV